MDELTQILSRHGLTLLFDAAHALFCSHRSRMIGGFGRAEVLSFHATKVVNSFEGGAIVTNDDELARRARLMRNFGFTDYDEVGRPRHQWEDERGRRGNGTHLARKRR